MAKSLSDGLRRQQGETQNNHQRNFWCCRRLSKGLPSGGGSAAHRESGTCPGLLVGAAGNRSMRDGLDDEVAVPSSPR